MTQEEARQQLRLTAEHAGLVRGKRGFGVRVESAQYSVVRKRLLPGAPHSSDSEGGGDKRFRLLGVPRSIDRPALKRVLGWQQRLCVRKDFKVGLLRQLWHLLAVLS